MRAARELLKQMEGLYPPGENRHHALHVSGDKLALTLIIGEKFHCFMLDDNDCTRPTDELINEIAHLMHLHGRTA